MDVCIQLRIADDSSNLVVVNFSIDDTESNHYGSLDFFTTLAAARYPWLELLA